MTPDYYEWFDPHAARATAAAAPVRERDAYSRGVATAQEEVTRVLRSRAFQGMEIAAETLGRQMSYAPEIKHAVAIVAAGLKQHAKVGTRIDERIERMDKVVTLSCDVQPFRLNYAVVLESEDLYRRAV